MKKYLIFFFLIFWIQNFAQDRITLKPELTTTDLEVNGVKAKSVKAREFLFENITRNLHFDSVNQVLYISTEVAGYDDVRSQFEHLFAYSLKNDSTIWTLKLNKKKHDYFFHEDKFFFEDNKKIYCLDIYSLDKKWEIPSQFYSVNPKYNVAITYAKGFWGSKNGLIGVDLKKGEILWNNSDIILRKGFNYMSYKDDSLLIFINDKMYGLNVLTGKAWNVDIQFFDDCSTGNWTGICKYCSNFYIDSPYFYIASTFNFHKFDFSGNEIWNHPIPENDGRLGRGILYKKDNYLYLINTGQTWLSNMHVFVKGKPFLAKYDTTGNLLKSYLFNSQDILDYKIDSLDIWVIQKKGISILDEDFNLKSYKEFRAVETKNWSILDFPIYVMNKNGKFEKRGGRDEKSIYIQDDDLSVQVMDKEFNIIDGIDKHNYYFKYDEDSCSSVYYNVADKKLILLNNKKEKASEFINITKVIRQAGKIIVADGKRVYIIREEDIF